MVAETIGAAKAPTPVSMSRCRGCSSEREKERRCSAHAPANADALLPRAIASAGRSALLSLYSAAKAPNATPKMRRGPPARSAASARPAGSQI